MEESALFDALDMSSTQAIFGPPGSGAFAYGGNLNIVGTPIEKYSSPADVQENMPFNVGSGGGSRSIILAKSNYVGVADARCKKQHCQFNGDDFNYDGNGMLYNISSVKIRDVFDGTSQTFFVGEGTGDLESKLHFMWATACVTDMKYGINGTCSIPGDGTYCWDTGNGFSSYHPGGAQFIMVDDSGHFISENTSQFILEAYRTRAGGETVEGL